MTDISLFVNGKLLAGQVEPRTHLADFLRDHLHLTGTHLRCEQGVCGACTLLIDGAPARSCITYAVLCQGAEVTTIEGLEEDEVVVALREAFSIEHGLQCGFCTPAMLVTARDIVTRLPDADEARIRTELSGNLCRCTGYAGIVRAVMRVAAAQREGGASRGRMRAGLGPVGARPSAGAAQPQAAAARAAESARSTAPEPPADLGLGERVPNLESELSFIVSRPVNEVWTVLADIGRVARCMPGAVLAEPPEGGRIKGGVAVKVGPIATHFSGSGLVVRDEERRRGTVYGNGRDRLSGSTVRAEVAYALQAESAEATLVALTVRALLAGPLAQFGRSGIVQDLVSRIAAEFARRLEHSLLTGEAPAASANSTLRAGALLSAIMAARIRALVGRLFPGRPS